MNDQQSVISNQPLTNSRQQGALAGGRFTALDVFRGMTVCFMIIVNTPGNGETTYGPLLHASWHGFTPTDLVFPSFLFAVGNAMSFVAAKYQSLPASRVLGRILKRTALIFLLGFLMYWFPFVHWDQHQLAWNPLETTRIFGVLQRIALTYCAASLLIYFLGWRRALLVSAIGLVAYWALLLAFGEPGQQLTLAGNAVLKLDTWLVGSQHLYRGEGVAFDPEGFLSTLPAIANVTAGYAVGYYWQKKGVNYEALAKLLLIGCALLAAAYVWDLFFPINKKLWTSSFVVLTVGLDCIILSLLVYVIEVLRHDRWTYFFQVFGRNPLFIYLLSEVVLILLYFFRVGDRSLFATLYQTGFEPAGPYLGSLLFALAFMLFCWGVGYLLDKRRIYIRV
jgi:predicted acyltransferase